MLKYKPIYWFVMNPFVKRALKIKYSDEDVKMIVRNAKAETIAVKALKENGNLDTRQHARLAGQAVSSGQLAAIRPLAANRFSQ